VRKIKGLEYIIGDVKSLETPDWIRVAALSEIPGEGLGHAVKADGLGIAIFRYENGEVICGWHGWHVRLSDGACGREKVCTKVFPCEVRDGDVYIKLY